MYVGLGFVQAPVAETPTCDAGYSYSAVLQTCVDNTGICDAGYSYNVLTGACDKSANALLTWLNTDKNAIYYVAGGALALVFLGQVMMGRR